MPTAAARAVRCPPNGERFWGPFYGVHVLWAVDLRIPGVADKEVLSIVEMTPTFKGDGQPVWGSAARLRLVPSQEGISAVIEDPAVKQKPSPRITLLNETQGDETWQIG